MSARLAKGYLGISEGELTINAIAVGQSGEVYCLPVSYEDAEALVAWDENGRIVDLVDIFPTMPVAIEDLLYFGEEHELTNNPDQLELPFGTPTD